MIWRMIEPAIAEIAGLLPVTAKLGECGVDIQCISEQSLIGQHLCRDEVLPGLWQGCCRPARVYEGEGQPIASVGFGMRIVDCLRQPDDAPALFQYP